METLKNLKSFEVINFFKKMNEIPRGSGNERAISDWLVKFAKDRNLEVIQDEALNVIIKKAATKGYENAPIIIIQGHMDMVCEKNQGTNHDFEKDPIAFIIDGDFIKADGTTLGADNGIAVAYALAILDRNDISHPALEVLVTTEEETGMGGATNLRPEDLNGRILVNIDSEEEGVLLVSCAGGVRAKFSVPVTYENTEGKYSSLAIKIRGLKGGHSGMEIKKERGNANKLMGRFLMDLNAIVDFKLASINGGAKMNAIPREADAMVLVRAEEMCKVKDKIKQWTGIFENELQGIDDDFKLTCEVVDGIDKVFSDDTKRNVLRTLFMLPNGVQTMSMAIEGLVQSSTNVGVVTTTGEAVEFENAVRSSVASLKRSIMDQMIVLAEILNCVIEFESDYPEWQYNPNSKIRTVFEEVYEKTFGKKAEISAIHAGLECGLIGDKFNGNLDQISFGPNIFDVHTPDEHISISSVDRMYTYLINVLSDVK
ncbi:MAG: aminoacyl-histidine dipeptidase [Clostridium sp.]|uniref:aminoacyl-histidine dipeptidase n=1 Tax=Clostridium sp. TaxID=1506 RepID=UPI0030368FC3